MKILVRIYQKLSIGNCETKSLDIESNKILVSELKKEIEDKLKIPYNQQILTAKISSNFIIMTDDLSLTNFNIKNNSKIHLEVLNDNNTNSSNIFSGSKNFIKNYGFNFGVKSNIKGNTKSSSKLSTIEESFFEYHDDYQDNCNAIDEIIYNVKPTDTFKLEECFKLLHITNPNIFGSDGNNLLHYYCYNGNSDFVAFLIDNKKADVNMPNSKAQTALSLAVDKNQINVVSTLMGCKEINADAIINTLKETVLHMACRRNNVKIISLLLHKCNFKYIYNLILALKTQKEKHLLIYQIQKMFKNYLISY